MGIESDVQEKNLNLKIRDGYYNKLKIQGEIIVTIPRNTKWRISYHPEEDFSVSGVPFPWDSSEEPIACL